MPNRSTPAIKPNEAAQAFYRFEACLSILNEMLNQNKFVDGPWEVKDPEIANAYNALFQRTPQINSVVEELSALHNLLDTLPAPYKDVARELGGVIALLDKGALNRAQIESIRNLLLKHLHLFHSMADRPALIIVIGALKNDQERQKYLKALAPYQSTLSAASPDNPYSALLFVDQGNESAPTIIHVYEMGDTAKVSADGLMQAYEDRMKVLNFLLEKVSKNATLTLVIEDGSIFFKKIVNGQIQELTYAEVNALQETVIGLTKNFLNSQSLNTPVYQRQASPQAAFVGPAKAEFEEDVFGTPPTSRSSSPAFSESSSDLSEFDRSETPTLAEAPEDLEVPEDPEDPELSKIESERPTSPAQPSTRSSSTESVYYDASSSTLQQTPEPEIKPAEPEIKPAEPAKPEVEEKAVEPQATLPIKAPPIASRTEIQEMQVIRTAIQSFIEKHPKADTRGLFTKFSDFFRGGSAASSTAGENALSDSWADDQLILIDNTYRMHRQATSGKGKKMPTNASAPLNAAPLNAAQLLDLAWLKVMSYLVKYDTETAKKLAWILSIDKKNSTYLIQNIVDVILNNQIPDESIKPSKENVYVRVSAMIDVRFHDLKETLVRKRTDIELTTFSKLSDEKVDEAQNIANIKSPIIDFMESLYKNATTAYPIGKFEPKDREQFQQKLCISLYKAYLEIVDNPAAREKYLNPLGEATQETPEEIIKYTIATFVNRTLKGDEYETAKFLKSAIIESKSATEEDLLLEHDRTVDSKIAQLTSLPEDQRNTAAFEIYLGLLDASNASFWDADSSQAPAITMNTALNENLAAITFKEKCKEKFNITIDISETPEHPSINPITEFAHNAKRKIQHSAFSRKSPTNRENSSAPNDSSLDLQVLQAISKNLVLLDNSEWKAKFDELKLKYDPSGNGAKKSSDANQHAISLIKIIEANHQKYQKDYELLYEVSDRIELLDNPSKSAAYTAIKSHYTRQHGEPSTTNALNHIQVVTSFCEQIDAKFKCHQSEILEKDTETLQEILTKLKENPSLAKNKEHSLLTEYREIKLRHTTQGAQTKFGDIRNKIELILKDPDAEATITTALRQNTDKTRHGIASALEDMLREAGANPAQRGKNPHESTPPTSQRPN